jgi:DNA-binding XRE family transcriptional regulator
LCESTGEVNIVAENLLRKIREQNLISKAELARKAGLSPLTVDRVEKGEKCRPGTMRRIILALGYDLSEKQRVFPHLKPRLIR